MAGNNLNVNPNDVESAITTWSGFVYQGKIALYHSLKVLTDDTAAESYLLQLDSLEDFAILASADSCLSLHQVKALKNAYYSGYIEAFKKLCAKGTQHNCADLNFHVAVKISGKTPAEIEVAHTNMKLYQYHNDRHYCQLKDADNAIEHVITEFFKKHSTDNWRQQPGYVNTTRQILDNVVLEKVIDIHRQVHANVASDNAIAYRETIPLSTLKAILTENLTLRIVGEDYFKALLKGDLNRYYQEFCIDCIETTADDIKIKMANFIFFINSLPDDGLLQFCRHIMPHRKVSLTSFSQYKDTTFQTEDLKIAFFKALYELRAISPNAVAEIGWRLPGVGMFVPTGISRAAQEINKVCEDILENILDTDFDLPYETSMLITAYMDAPSLQEVINNTNDVNENDNDEPLLPEEEKIMRWKKIGMCSIEEAKTQII